MEVAVASSPRPHAIFVVQIKWSYIQCVQGSAWNIGNAQYTTAVMMLMVIMILITTVVTTLFPLLFLFSYALSQKGSPSFAFICGQTEYLHQSKILIGKGT